MPSFSFSPGPRARVASEYVVGVSTGFQVVPSSRSSVVAPGVIGAVPLFSKHASRVEPGGTLS